MASSNDQLFDLAFYVSKRQGYQLRRRSDLFSRKHRAQGCDAVSIAHMIRRPEGIGTGGDREHWAPLERVALDFLAEFPRPS